MDVVDESTVELTPRETALASDEFVGRPAVKVSSHVKVLSDPNGLQSESIAALRAQLLSQHLRDGRRSMAVCSAAGNVGATFVSTNLAAAFAMAGKKTLLIDANMREPGVAKFLQVESDRPGLMQYLADADDEMDVPVESDVLPNLSIIYAGASSENPQDLLAGRKFTDLITDAMRSYDITIVDAPPAKDYADALRIAMIVRYALLVARKDHTKVADLRALRDQLLEDRVRIVGAFLNEF